MNTSELHTNTAICVDAEIVATLLLGNTVGVANLYIPIYAALAAI